MHELRVPTGLDPSLSPLVLGRWCIQKGQELVPDATLATIESPGTIIELKSRLSGALLEVLASPGQVLEPRQVICRIGPAAQARPVAQEAKGPGKGLGKVIPILMPQAGQTMEEGTILAWKVKEGDMIQAGQVIVEIETDKAAMDVEATDSGRLARIVAREGQVVPVKTPIAYLAETDADLEAFLGSQGRQAGLAPVGQVEVQPRPSVQQQPVPTTASQPQAGPVRASPAARKLAAEMGIDLTKVPSGSGPGGRIVTTDLAGLKPSQQTKAISRMRLAIARNLLWSKQNIPHFYAKRVMEVSRLLDAYRRFKSQFGCTINDLVVAAVARTVRQFPAFRSQFRDETIVELPSVNIGVAVGTEQGLTVPVLIWADRLDLKTIAQRTKMLVENARAGKLEGVGQGVITVTNLGMFGVEEFYAIINPPESAILSVGAARQSVKVQDGNIIPTWVMTCCLSVDHRVIDGILAAQFLARLAELFDQPDGLVGPADKD